ncbi:UDP-galactopyranose mutase [Candidatus Woesearchaeota archaeon]|nr:UDP-galactopyranose mutase [Candidatus Woesearchaeota archaeon]
MYDHCLVIGAGMTGATIARKLAEQGEKVLVVEIRNHIGGNCHDYFTRDGNYIQTYGPHIFHTSDREVWEFLSEFTEWNDYQHKVLAHVDGKLLPVPFNLKSLGMSFSKEQAERMKSKLLAEIGMEKSITILKLREAEDPDLKILGEYVYEKIFLNYTIKQWDNKPDEIDPQVTNRVPVFVSEDDRYFRNDPFQGIPIGGFQPIFERMLDHKNIKIMLQTNCKDMMKLFNYKHIFVTSPIDQFFEYKFGNLKYRRIHLKFEEHSGPSIQENSVINYPNDHDYTRITEFNKFLNLDRERTTICKEYPSWSKGYLAYPLLKEDNMELLAKYNELAKDKKNTYFAGRLAECKYYNMDQACRRGINLVKDII